MAELERVVERDLWPLRDPSEAPERRVKEATAFKPRILTCPHNYKEREKEKRRREERRGGRETQAFESDQWAGAALTL